MCMLKLTNTRLGLCYKQRNCSVTWNEYVTFGIIFIRAHITTVELTYEVITVNMALYDKVLLFYNMDATIL